MSLHLIIQTLTRLHNGAGQLRSASSNCQTFQRQSNFNPRDGDSWSLFNLSTGLTTQIIRVLRRTRQTTSRLGSANVIAPNRSSELSRLFMVWAQAHADNGADARPTQRAQQAYLLAQYQWTDELARETSQATDAVRRMTKQKRFYDTQVDVFTTLIRLADATVRHGLTTAHQAEALAFKVQFEQIKGHSNNISNDYAAGLSNAANWRRNLNAANTEMRAWLAWSRNRRQVEQSLQRQRAPR